MIELTVKTLDARNHEFSLEDESTVAQLKGLISERIGLSTEVQRLIFRGRVLSDNSKLSELDVNGKVVHLVEREPPRPGQRPPANDNAEVQPPRGRLFQGGPITPQQMENVLLEAMGVRRAPGEGGPGAGYRAINPEENALQAGPTTTRLALVRRMIDRVQINVTALDRMEHMLPDVNSERASTSSVPPTAPAAATTGQASAPTAPPAPVASAAPSAPSATTEDEASRVSDEWVDATEDVLTDGRPEADEQPVNTSTEVTPETPSSASSPDGNNGTAPAAAGGEEGPERARRVSEEMASAVRDLVGLQEPLGRHLRAFADTLTQNHVVDSERTRIRQRMVNRMSDTMHNLSHLYHALSDVEVTLGPQGARCLSAHPPRRLQIATQINVTSNMVGGGAPPGGGSRQPNAQPSQPPGASSVTVTSSAPSAPQTQSESQSGRQPTVHVDIRPEPLSYQVEIETRVPIAFAINNGQGAGQGGQGAQGVRPGISSFIVTETSPSNASPSASQTNNNANSTANERSNQRPARQPMNTVIEPGSDFIMGVSVPINLDALSQGSPNLIAGPFPFGNGVVPTELIQSVVHSALTQERRRSQPERRHGRRSQRAQHAHQPYRAPVFDRFLPCLYDPVRRSRSRRRSRMTQLLRSAARASNSFTTPAVQTLMRLLQGFTIHDLFDMEHYLPGECWLVDALTLISRVMTVSELIGAWAAVSGLDGLRAPLRSLVAGTVLRWARPRDDSHALQLYSEAADTLVTQLRDLVAWLEQVIGTETGVHLERSLRQLARARLPQLMLALAEEPRAGDDYSARLVALVSRAFVEASAVVQRASRDRNALNTLFVTYADEFLQHMETQVVAQIVEIVTPHVSELARLCRSVNVEAYLVQEQPPDALPPPSETPRSSAPPPVAPRPAPGAAPSAPATPPAPRPPQRLATSPDAASTAAAAEQTLPSDWVAAIRRDAAQQRVSGAPRVPYSDAYLSGAPARKRKLLTQGKPHALADMMSECIREAAQTATPTGPGGPDEVARAADAGVRRAYWDHIRTLARARVTEDCTPERYPASYRCFLSPNKRPCPEERPE